MKELVEVIARALVDHQDEVKVETVDGPQATIVELRVHPEDCGKALGGVVLRAFWVDRNHTGRGVFHFEGVTSINDAEKLRGLEVQIPLQRRAQVPAGSFFVTDLIGCSVFEIPASTATMSSSPCSLSETPALLGKVRDVYFPGEGQAGTPLLALDTANGELLIP